MNIFQISGMLIFIILMVGGTKGEFSVNFWSSSVYVECDKKTLMKDSKEIISPINNFEEKDNGYYYCVDADNIKTHHFYIKGKACENCIEMDTPLVAGIILGDLLLTGAFAYMVYAWAQRRSGAPRSKPTKRMGSAPPVPNPDYEQLILESREKGTYSTVHRTG